MLQPSQLTDELRKNAVIWLLSITPESAGNAPSSLGHASKNVQMTRESERVKITEMMLFRDSDLAQAVGKCT